ncbi:MAG: DNA primase, partial [Acidimicrobiales bacterium]
LASEHIALKRQGRRWVGLCPFHPEKTPSFSVNAEEGLYYCFGCQASGDAISFVRALDGLDFPEAVERLAGRAGIVLQIEQDQAGAQARSRRRELTETMEAVVEWYHQRLLVSPDAARARDYLRSRGYDGAVVRQFKLGWAPADWDGLCKGLGRSRDVMVESGLAFVNRRGRLQDGFRSRVLFPIFDPAGRPVAIGGRVLPSPDPGRSDQGPKYKNSPESGIYSKRRVLYGLNWAKAEVVHHGEIIVCEGYTDVIGFFGVGLNRAVATCGTALGEDHFKLMKNFASRIVLAYDADGAGQAAAARFYEWEKRHDLDIAVARMPTGSDPADLARGDPDALRLAVSEALPFMAFRLARVLDQSDLNTAEGRGRAAERSMSVIAEHPSDLVRDQYLMDVSDRCRVPPERLRPLLHAALNAARTGKSLPSRTTPDPGLDGTLLRGLEYDALLLAVHQPEEMAERLEEVLFSTPVNREVFSCLASSTTVAEALECAGPQGATLLARLCVDEATADPVEVSASLVRMAAVRVLNAMQARSRSGLASGAVDQDGDQDGDDLVRRMAWLKLEMEPLLHGDVSDPAVIDAANRLLAWLSVEGDGYV